jgi:dienelactone hydrolase
MSSLGRRGVRLCGVGVLAGVLGASWLYGQAATVRVAREAGIVLEPEPHLKGTALLKLPEGIARPAGMTQPKQGAIFVEQLRQANEFFLRQIAGTQAERDLNWKLDFRSRERYQASLEGHRKSLWRMLGLRKNTWAGIAVERRGLGNGVEDVKLSLEEGVEGDGLVFVPKGKVVGAVVVIPDEDELRERFAGILVGKVTARWLKELLGGGLVVCVPRTVERKTDYAYGEQTHIDRRLLLHRLGFIVGRTLVGLEVEQILGFRDYLEKRFGLGSGQVGLMGLRQGGMTALYAGAAEGKFGGVGVVDYFQQREECWKEPADRMLYGQLKQFGDGELAGLIAPRRLEVVYTQGGPTPRESVEAEGRRARRFYEGLGDGQNLLIAGVSGVDEGLERVAKGMKAVLAKGRGGEEAVEVRVGEAEAKQGAMDQFERWHEYLREQDKVSEEERRRHWGLLETPEGGRAAKAAALRKELGVLVGEIRVRDKPLNPRTRLLKVTDKFVAYEVLLDVVEGVEAYGQLLVPRGKGERRPAVICQHGLGGTPADITGIGTESDPIYHALGAHLGDLGYVIFAPYINVPIRQEVLINPLVRQAAALGMMRTSLELAKLHRVVDFLQSLEFVDRKAIGYYGLSYGGYSAIWMPPLDPRIKASVISGHFNDWRMKLTEESGAASYLQYQDADFYNWNVLERFTHLELVAAMYPRPVCVEYGEGDGTTTPEWHTRAWQEVERWKEAWGLDGLEEKVARVHYDGVHEIHGVGTIDFLNRWLLPERPAGRDYNYDLLGPQRDNSGLSDASDATLPYLTHRLDSGAGAVVKGRFYVSSLSPVFTGLAIRLSRVGQPGDVIVRFGSKDGAADLGEARIPAQSINPLFDLWFKAETKPVRLDPTKLYFFEVRVTSGRGPRDCYWIYGPKPYGGKDIDPNFGLSYEVLSVGKSFGQARLTSRFDFVRPLLASYQGPPVITVGAAPRQPDEVSLTAQLSVRVEPGADEVVQMAAEDLRRFLQGAPKDESKGVAGSTKSQIELLLVPSGVDGVSTPEGYRIEVSPRGVSIEGRTSRGVMRGVYDLEEQIRSRKAFLVKGGSVVRNCRFARRITCAVHLTGVPNTETSYPLVYTDGLLQRISHSGFNALYVWVNTEEVTLDSQIFPELDDPEAAVRLARLDDLSRRARRYGIDVYLYFATGYNQHLPESFFQKHPETRGYGWGPPMCTSTPSVRQYYAETVATILHHAPLVRGLIVIYDSEGFWYCGNSEQTLKECPRCRHRTQQAVAAELLTTLDTAMHETGGQDKELIAWNYNVASQWVPKMFPLLPKDIIIQPDFDKGMDLVKEGIQHRTEDYNISSVGPPELFADEYEAARAQGLRLTTKTENSVSQEFIFVPYIPCMEQWYRRVAKIREYDLNGWFGNWFFYGFTGSRTEELINRMSFDPAPSMVELLQHLAQRDFGPEASPYILRAWHDFSEGIRAYPYSDAVARTPGPVQKGPSQPLFLDRKLKGFGPWRSWQNDLKWTAPWGPEISRKYLSQVKDWYAKGNAELEAALRIAPVAYRSEIESEWRVGRTIQSAAQMVLNLIDWIEARDRYDEASSESARREALKTMKGVVVAERENAQDILPVLETDSRLGYTSDAAGVMRGGLFTPTLVRWAVGELDDLLLRQLPALEQNVVRSLDDR